MAKLLDDETYALVEWRLHHEALMKDTIQDFEAEVLLSSRGTDYSQPLVSGGNTPSDPVSGKAFRLEEGTIEVRRARRWLRVIERTREWFSADSMEHKFYLLYFGKTATIELVAAAMGVSRQWAGKLRDNIVFRGAMYAIEARLFRLEDAEGGKEIGA